MRWLIACLFFLLPIYSHAAGEACTLNHNVEGIIESIANGDTDKVIDYSRPVPYQRGLNEVEQPRDMFEGLNLTQQRYDSYYSGVANGRISSDFHEAVQNHIKNQIGDGYTRALKPNEVLEIMRDGRTQAGQFFSAKTGGPHVGHNQSAVYVRCVKDCDQYFEAASTGSGVQAVRPIPRENLEVIVPDYDAALAHARANHGTGTRGSGNGTGLRVDDDGAIIIDDMAEISEFSDDARKLFQMTGQEIETAKLSDFVANAKEFNDNFKVLKFDKSSAVKIAQNGAMNGGVFKVMTENGETMIVKILKERGEPMAEEYVLQEIRNAKLMHNLGIGPESHLMRTKSGYNLVMKESPGVNIKELLFANKATDSTKNAIDKVLGMKTKDMHQARVMYARKIMNDPKALEEMRRIGRVLDQNKIDAEDFQMMIQPSDGLSRRNVQVIDSAGFEKRPNLMPQTNENRVEDLIDELTRLAERNPLSPGQ